MTSAWVDGMPVTSAIRTWFDLARHQPLIEAVAALDWALHRGLVSPSELSVYLEAPPAGMASARFAKCWTTPSQSRNH